MRDIELVESKTIDPSVSQESIPKPKPGSKNTSFSEDTVIKEDIVRTPKKGEKQSASPPRAESRRLQDARKRAEDVKATTPKKLDHKTLEDSIAASNKKIEEAKAEVIIKKSSRSRASSSSSAAKISRENSRAEEEQRAELKKALTLPDKQPAEEKKQSAAAQSLGVKRSVTNLLPSPSSDRIFNFVMLGAHGCGKTSFLSRISTGAVPRTTSPSKVTSHKDKVIIGQSTGTKVRVRFTDIADKDFSRRAPLANGLIFFVDLTNKESLQAAIELNTQFTDLMEEKGQLFDIKKIIVATKSDATNKSLQVAGKLIQSFASSIFATVVPVSAQTGDGFTEFESLLTECV